MKFSRKMALLLVTTASISGLVGCKSVAKMPVNFVAVTSSDYNAEMTFGTYDYKFQGKVDEKNGSFKLVATTIRRSTGSSGGGGGWGPGPGGGSGPTFDGFATGEEQQPGGGEEQGGGFPGGFGRVTRDGFPGGGGFPGGPGGQTATLESISVDTSRTEFYINEVVSPFTCLPQNSEGDVNWSTSDETIATVSEKGAITPIKVGEATITGVGKTDSTKSASITIKVVEEDLRQYDWSVSAKCEVEPGYGYKLSFEDEGHTVVHTDFDKTEGRHSFHYSVTINGTSSTIHFQAKDPTFKDQLAKDYKKWDERDSTYIFYAKATGNNNSVATAYMYLHGSDHSVVLNSPSGSEREYTFGLTWEETADKKIIVHNGPDSYEADTSINPEHPGYRLNYDGKTYYCSLNPDVKWKKLVAADFEGANTHEFVGSYVTEGPDGGTKEINLNLAESGAAKLYLGSSAPTAVGVWAKDAQQKLTITFGEIVGEFALGEDSKYSISIVITISSFFGSSQKTIALTQVK